MKYTTNQIRDFVRCPQFGYSSYGKWGALKLEVRETIRDLADAIDSADYVIKEYHQRIDKAIEYIEIEIESNKKSGSPDLMTAEMLEMLLEILKGSDKE